MEASTKDLLEAGAYVAAILTCIGAGSVGVVKIVRRLRQRHAPSDGSQSGEPVKMSQIQNAGNGAVSIQAGRDINSPSAKYSGRANEQP